MYITIRFLSIRLFLTKSSGAAKSHTQRNKHKENKRNYQKKKEKVAEEKKNKHH